MFRETLIHCKVDDKNSERYRYKIFIDSELTQEELKKLETLLASFPNSRDSSWPDKFKSTNFAEFSKKLLLIAANAYDSQGYTMLGIAARTGSNARSIQQLIDIGAHLDQPDINLGKSPIYWSISNVCSNGEEHLPENLQALKCLLDNGARIDKGYGKLTPFEYAKSRKFFAAAKVIEEHIHNNQETSQVKMSY